MCIKWGQATSDYFTISNGVRHDLSKQYIDARSGYFIEHQCINHVMHADDNCLLAPSALCLQKAFRCVLLF